MGAVAQGGIACLLASAEPDPLFLFRLILDRRYTGTLVGTVTEWLAVTAATGTPEVVLSCLHHDGVRRLTGDQRFLIGHNLFLES